MKFKTIAMSVASAISTLTLSACGAGENEASGPRSDRQVQAFDAAPLEGNGGGITEAPSTPGDPDLPDVAGANCVEELAILANRDRAEIIIDRIKADETGPTHYLMIQGAAAPWICDTNPDGSVVDLSYSQEG